MRDLSEQPKLPRKERHLELPSPTMEKKRYKIFGIVIDRDLKSN